MAAHTHARSLYVFHHRALYAMDLDSYAWRKPSVSRLLRAKGAAAWPASDESGNKVLLLGKNYLGDRAALVDIGT